VNYGGNPLNTTLKVPGSQVWILIDGNYLGLAEDHTVDPHFAELTDPVGGSIYQLLSAGAFLNEINATCIFSTDLPDLSQFVDGDLGLHTVVFLLTNTAGGTRTITCGYCKVFRQTGKHAKDQLYRWTLRILSNAPWVFS